VRSVGLALALVALSGAARAGTDLPDPTQPEIGAAAAEPETRASRFALRAVLIGPQRRVAVINGSAVGVGESVDGARVLAIEAGRVRIGTAEGERWLELVNGVRAEPAAERNR
jgi:hypothetical protein